MSKFVKVHRFSVVEVEGNDMLIILVNIINTIKKKQQYFLGDLCRGMIKKKRPIIEVDSGEMSVRGEHIARGCCVFEVPQIRVRTRLILMVITMVMVVKNIFQLKTLQGAVVCSKFHRYASVQG